MVQGNGQTRWFPFLVLFLIAILLCPCHFCAVGYMFLRYLYRTEWLDPVVKALLWYLIPPSIDGL